MTAEPTGFQNGTGTHAPTPTPTPAANVTSLEASVKSLVESVHITNGNVNALTTAITEVKNRVEALEKKDSQKAADLANLEKKHTSTRYWAYAAIAVGILPYVIKLGGKLFKKKPETFTQPIVA